MTTAQEDQKARGGAASDEMRPLLYQVRSSRKETHDTFTLELLPKEKKALSPFLPGQFNMLYAFGVGECAISISGDPSQSEPLKHTTRVVGTVTKALSTLRPGDVLGVRGPYGSSWPTQAAEGQDVVLVAGGIGLAPLRPVICHLLNHRAKYGKIVLLYGARTPQDMLYRKELEKWGGRLDVEVIVAVDRAEKGWHGNVGVVTKLIKRAPFDRLNTVAMLCGPEVMMHFTILELLQRGIDEESIFLSMERNMKCAVGFCGHCQFGPTFVCKDGPVFRYDNVKVWLEHREL
jgi:NAD(P)H-flavin reductase